MSRVLILSKTNAGQSYCVGGLDLGTGKSLRLLTEKGYFNPLNTKYKVGQIWDINYTRNPNNVAPHVEGVRVTSKTNTGRVAANIKAVIAQHFNIWSGSPNRLFNGRINFTDTGIGYISPGNIPRMSTGFWTPDDDLRHFIYYGDRYSYRPNEYDPYRNLKYVGTQPIRKKLPAGTLIRVSLSTWYKPTGWDEKACILQLSGWFI